MIAIVNMGETEPGYYFYVLRINKDEITTFEHKREDGLAVCLEKAAQAVREKEG